MKYGEFRRIEEPSAVQPAQRNEISPLVAAVGHIESGCGRSEASEGAGYASCWLRDPESRTRSHLNDQARLVAELGGRRAGNHFQRLNRVRRNLVGKNFAGLICHHLPIYGKCSLRMVAKRVHVAV